jgi:hypothetical protein
MIRRRELLLGAGAAVFAAPSIAGAQQPTVIKVGTLKLIHSITPYFYQRFTPPGYAVGVRTPSSPSRSISASSGLPRPCWALPPASRSW